MRSAAHIQSRSTLSRSPSRSPRATQCHFLPLQTAPVQNELNPISAKMPPMLHRPQSTIPNPQSNPATRHTAQQKPTRRNKCPSVCKTNPIPPSPAISTHWPSPIPVVSMPRMSAPDKKYNVAVIGYGWAATAHIDAINATQQAKVTAVYSSRPLDSATLSAKHGSPIKTHQNLQTLLADPAIHVVDITSYPSQHAVHAIAAANAKKHIILEKPIANTLAELNAIAAAVETAKVKTCICFELRYSGQMQTTKALLDQNLLGQLHYAEVDYYHGIGPWYGQFRWNTAKKDGGSALLTAGCHALDALLLCVNDEVESVTSLSTKSKSPIFAPYEYPTTSVTLLKFKNGAIGKCAAIVDCHQPYYFHTHLVGSHGSLLDDKFHSTKLNTNKTHWSKLSMKLADSGDVTDHPYQSQFQAFFNALDENKEMPLTSLNEAKKTFEVIFAADQSAQNNGQPVFLNP